MECESLVRECQGLTLCGHMVLGVVVFPLGYSWVPVGQKCDIPVNGSARLTTVRLQLAGMKRTYWAHRRHVVMGSSRSILKPCKAGLRASLPRQCSR